jgi:hypothetical protein
MVREQRVQVVELQVQQQLVLVQESEQLGQQLELRQQVLALWHHQQ